ncbi:hypothetical protein [Bacillus altitudinis]|uniref:hypothetical protein n=1 Tax=Bacillus altitudinis TaxID=293387 RepID=UPI0039BF2E4F
MQTIYLMMSTTNNATLTNYFKKTSQYSSYEIKELETSLINLQSPGIFFIEDMLIDSPEKLDQLRHIIEHNKSSKFFFLNFRLNFVHERVRHFKSTSLLLQHLQSRQSKPVPNAKEVIEDPEHKKTIKEIEEEEEERQVETVKDDDPFTNHLEKKALSKNVFNKIILNDLNSNAHLINRTIGVWSPLHRVGVSTFVLNFAIYLASQKQDVTVIETLNNDQFLKTFLNRYSTTPENWQSYISALYKDAPNKNVRWTYKGVKWLPLDDGDHKLSIDKETLDLFIGRLKAFDFSLMDLPTGPFMNYSKDILHNVDELWILCDDDYQHLLKFKSYIHNLTSIYEFKPLLIHYKTFDFSHTEEISLQLDLPVIAKFEALYKEAHANHYSNAPLITLKDSKKVLTSPFSSLFEHLTGNQPKSRIRSFFSPFVRE